MNHRDEGIWTETPMTFGTFMTYAQNKPLNLTWLSYFKIKAWSESIQSQKSPRKQDLIIEY